MQGHEFRACSAVLTINGHPNVEKDVLTYGLHVWHAVGGFSPQRVLICHRYFAPSTAATYDIAEAHRVPD
eukprot:scaffold101582_cov22-Prasinocladus_malaysianus.AAC.1